MHRLSYGFILGYHGCDRKIGEALLAGNQFKHSKNDYDWLGPGIYFWEANPARGLSFAHESSKRKGSDIKQPFVVGAVIDLGQCLDLTTELGIGTVKRGFESLKLAAERSKARLPKNSEDKMRRKLDCAVVQRVHQIYAEAGLPSFDSVRGVFTEGSPAYDGAGFDEKTHIQIAVRNPSSIKGIFRVPNQHLSSSAL